MNDDAHEAWLRIWDMGQEANGERIPLKVYLLGANLGETDPLKIPIARLARAYSITFGFGVNEIQTWIINGFLEKINCQFFSEEGKVITERPLPRDRVWLLLSEECYFKPGIKPLEEVVAQLADRFILCLIDLAEVAGDQFFIVDRLGLNHAFMLSSGQGRPYLLGQKLAGILVEDGYPLYEKDTLRLRIPSAVNGEGLGLWCLQIRPRAGYPGVEKHYTFLELENRLSSIIGESAIELSLDVGQLLGEELCGRYRLSISDPEQKRIQFNINFISNGSVIFYPAFYTLENEDKSISLSISLPKGVAFKALPPAQYTADATGTSTVS